MKEGVSTCKIYTVTFDYENLSGNISEHTVEDQRSGINRLLQTITLKIGDNIWRKYNFSYNGTNTDFAPTLKSVQVQNHLGETLKPTEFQWNEIPMKNLVSKEANIDTKLPLKFDQTEKDGTIYQAVDFNGDGISDIVKIYSDYFTNGSYTCDNQTYNIAIFLSQNNGVYADTTVYEDIRTIGSLFETSIDFHGQSIVDFDGDGISDILIPTTEFKKEPFTSEISFDLILGKDIVSKRQHKQQYGFPLSSSADSVIFVSGDINADDKDEFIYFENKLNNNSKCIGKIVSYNAGNFSSTDLFLTMPYSPKKAIISDFNNNGLSDLLLFHEKGYCIFLNKGTDNINGIFDSEPSFNHYSNENFSQWETCDMNGDGLVDFVSTSEQGKKLVVHYNQGSGTFRKEIQDLDLAPSTSTGHDMLLSFDINNSGRTDLILVRENGNRKYSFYTIFNTLNGLKLNQQVNFSSDKKLHPGHLTVGSFSRSGCAELMSFGIDLTSPSQQKQDTRLRYYRLAQSSSGKLNRVIDGLGNTTTIGYGISSNASHAQKIGSAIRIGGVATSTVTSATIHNSTGMLTGSNSYSFKSIVYHTQGLGFVGFDETSVKNNLSGELQHTVISDRDP
ncbi:MAG: VCBS repeat-containing protein, partial [Paramuribaculum sp.]|nr:VCBS repeat-containing protein [Paramuribaculum sp.]